jgi:hypothetical protein
MELPPLSGPLDAFCLRGDPDAEATHYLAGDLHATHPEALNPPPAGPRDLSLDAATVTVGDDSGPPLEAIADDGIWCLRLDPARGEEGFSFVLHDSEDRARIWLLLPPPKAMLGIGRLWLSSVGPPAGSVVAAPVLPRAL